MPAKHDLNKQATKPMRNKQSCEQDNMGTGSLLMEEAGQFWRGRGGGGGELEVQTEILTLKTSLD